MLSNTALLLSTMVLGAFAMPEYRPTEPPRGYCMTDLEAEQIAKNWRGLIGAYSKDLAEAALDPGYTDYSASALSLNSVCQQAKSPPLKATDALFTSSSIFELAQGSQAAIPSTELNVWHTCSEVTMRSEMCIMGDCADPVIGIIAIETTKAPNGNKFPYHISKTYSEFDSEAWIKALKSKNACKDPATAN